MLSVWVYSLQDCYLLWGWLKMNCKEDNCSNCTRRVCLLDIFDGDG